MLFLLHSVLEAKEFKKIQQWKHGDQGLYGGITHAAVDKDNHLVVGFGEKLGWRVITPTGIKAFGPAGQGPSDLSMVFAMCPFNDDLAFILLGQSVKIFTKKDGKYEWKETRWLKQNYYPHVIRDGLFLDNKWFLAGINFLDLKDEKLHVNLLKVYHEDGKTSLNLLEEWHDKRETYRGNDKDFYVVPYKNRVFLLAEDKLKAYEISVDQLKLLKEWPLDIPSFYKKMPVDFYSMGKISEDSQAYDKNYYKWKTGYSRITNAVMEDGYLVLQLRTCSAALKKFALLFYNAGTMKL
ncbi:MAG TPA: hypothetical protein VK469_15360, partial [Candidatus Kapabacteria bacterium]|nr:hypothetical protein [Candidatus Kapabacteria bacterium]